MFDVFATKLKLCDLVESQTSSMVLGTPGRIWDQIDTQINTIVMDHIWEDINENV